MKRKFNLPLRGSTTVLYRDMVVFWRSKYSEMITTAASPLTFFLIFAFGLRDYISDVNGVPYVLFVAPGLISMAALEASWEASAWSLWFHRMHLRSIDEYRVNPISIYDIITGKIFSGFVQGIFKGVVVALLLLPLTGMKFHAVGVLIYLVYLILGSMIFSCIGIICGTLLDKPEELGRTYTVGIMPLIFLGGMFFPIDTYPDVIQFCVKLLPVTAVFDGARAVLLTGKIEAYYFAVLFFYAALSLGLSVYIFDKKIEE